MGQSGQVPVTVVIPAFRRPEMIERALRSVFAQEPAPAEVIVVDDASPDDTGARARALGAQVIVRAQNGGESEARNTGLAAAHHDWVALLDSDDEWLPGHLATLWAHRAGHALVGSAVLSVGPGPHGHRVYGWAGRRPRVLRGPADVAVPENKLTASSVLLRREVAIEIGGFRADLSRSADLDLWIRMLEKRPGLAIPRVTALYHLHADQISREQDRMREARRDVLAAYAERPWCTRTVRRRCAGALAWDETQAALTRGSAPLPTLIGLAIQMTSPARLVGLLQLLAGRRRARRLARRYTSTGEPVSAPRGREERGARRSRPAAQSIDDA